MDPKVSALHHLPLFGLVHPRDLIELANGAQIIKVAKGAKIYRANSRFDNLIYLNSGVLRSTEVGRDGRMTSVANIPPGQLIGLFYLFVKKVRLDSLQALQDSEIWILDIKNAETALLNSPRAMERYCQLLIGAMHNLHKERLSLLQDRAESRILAVLAKYAKYRDKAITLEDLPSQQALADLSNTSRETDSRAINKWFDEGVLEKIGGKINIKKLDSFKFFM